MDRVGLGWRPELAAGILANLDRIDAVEVIADDWFSAGADRIRALRTLAGQVPVYLHGVGLGLASASAVAPWRCTRMARLVEAVRPEGWSEHLAFVRADGIEIGHLAAPPRTAATIAGALANIERAAAIVGSLPQLENIATLLEPPASTVDEADWVAAIITRSGAPLLLDLHNLYANALNFGVPPAALLTRFPLDRVSAIHLSGGCWTEEPGGSEGGRRLLDDHGHDVPGPVFDLLAAVAELVPQPVTVIIERDRRLPRFAVILEQLAQARAALARGRAKRAVAA